MSTRVPTLLRAAPLGAALLILSAACVQAQVAVLPESEVPFGSTLASGDFNGDGILDLAVGAVGDEGLSARAVKVIHGTDDGLSDRGQVWRPRDLGGTDGAHDVFGAVLAAADFDADGFCDLVIGVVPNDAGAAADAGALYVVFGTDAGLSSARNRHLDSVHLGHIVQDGPLIRAVLTTGNVNGDGYPDLIVGVPGEGLGERIDAGTAFVLYGSPSGLSPVGYYWSARTAEADRSARSPVSPGDAGGDQ